MQRRQTKKMMDSDVKKAPARTLARLADVAQRAGVSTATADRVLNRRPGVRAITAQKVWQAAADLGYLPDAVDTTPAREPMRLVFLLPRGSNRFLRMLGDTVGYAAEHVAPLDARCQVEYVESFNPDALAQALLKRGRRADGIAFMALEHPAVREAVDTLAARGVPTVTLISDIANCARAAYVGLDNRAAGRTAGYLIGRFIGPRAAQVALIAGSRHYRAHEERESGFLQLYAERFQALQVVGLREGYDDEQRNYEQARQLIDQYPQLAGIYNIGGASDGVARALREAGLQHRVVFIGHGLTPDTRALLIDGTMDAVITQSPLEALMNCVRIFANLRHRRSPMTGVEFARSQVIFRENLP